MSSEFLGIFPTISIIKSRCSCSSCLRSSRKLFNISMNLLSETEETAGAGGTTGEGETTGGGTGTRTGGVGTEVNILSPKSSIFSVKDLI